MVSITLPKSPKEYDFEDFISAHLQSGGYYIERNIIEKEIESVLELDIITTSYNESFPKVKIYEVKSGDWGFQDIFKVRGWMDYLKISESGFIANKNRRNIEFIQEKAKSIEVELTFVSDLNKSKELLSELIGNKEICDNDITTWRYSYWVERFLLKRLTKCKKMFPDKKCYKNMDNYIFEINSEVFFTENVIEKAIKLYKAFQKYPFLSAKCGNELIGGNFDDDHKILPSNVFNETFYTCKNNDIQLSTFIEHRSRLAILKSAIDYLLYEKAGMVDKIEAVPIFSFEIGDHKIEYTSFDSLPPNFRQGLEKISNHEYFNRYPIFWQWFFWIFGGFILTDHEDSEYQLLSQKTGIPIEEIPNAFNSYQYLFPVDGGWFSKLKNSNIKIMKMFPVPFMGIGTYYRRIMYSKNGDLEELNLKGLHTLKDLNKWNNLTVTIFEESCDSDCISYN